MADADEAVIHSSGAAGEQGDLDDETQDFRFLSSLTQYISSASPLQPD